MKKLLSGIELALLLLGTIGQANAYYSLGLANSARYPNGMIEFYSIIPYWDKNDPRPFPCGPKPWGNPQMDCIMSLQFYSAGGVKKIPTEVGSFMQFPRESGFKTYGEVGVDLTTGGPIGTTNRFRSSYPSNLWEPGMCAQIAVNGQTVEGYNCIKIPPPGAAVCETVTPVMNLSHNIVYSDNIDGNTASQIFSLKCVDGNPVDIQVRAYAVQSLRDEVPLRPDGSLISKLRINGHDAQTGVRINNAIGIHTLEISSTLRSVGKPDAGPFSGNAIAVVEYP